MSSSIDFRAVSHPVRVFSGQDALSALQNEVARHGARRAFIVCGRSVARKTPLITHMTGLLGDRCAGVYDGLQKDSPLGPVVEARDAARAAGADLVIAVGGGSVIQAARVVVILLAEQGDPHELCTQYPAGRPAQSVRLMAPKIPIINVCTLPTSAANRAGSGIKDVGADHRLEYFDPKTRPVALFWDRDALATAPRSLALGTSLSVYWRAVMNLGAVDPNPLVEGDRLQAYRLAARALPRVADGEDLDARIELCAAAFLQNRDHDVGGLSVRPHWVARVVYAFATALFNRFPHISQGQANAALTPTVMRHLGERDPESLCRLGEGIGAWSPGMPEADAPLRAADQLEQLFGSLGFAARLRDLEVPQSAVLELLEDSMKNFNADPKREFLTHREVLHETLQACW